MKKTLLTIATLTLIGTLFQNCIKNANCVDLVHNIDSTRILYNSDSTKCASYKNALNEWLGSTCASTHTPAKDEYQAALNALPCK
jgi:hypothetical protein